MLEGLIGTSIEDPRTAATMALAQGLLSSPKVMRGLSSGLLGYQGAMADSKKASQLDELRQMQVQQMQMAMEQAKAQQQQAAIDKAMLMRQFGQVQGIDANSASGIAGPRPEALRSVGQMPAFNPLNMLQGGASMGAVKQAQELASLGQHKIKDYKEVRMPDGSVQIVGFDEYGKPVDTGRTPFKDAQEMDLGGTKALRDPLTNNIFQQFGKTQTPDSIASGNITMRGQNMADARSRDANNIQRQSARTQVMQTPEGLIAIDKRTNQAAPVTMGGSPVRSEDAMKKTANAKVVLGLLDAADKLLPTSTGSAVGTGVDNVLGFVGVAPKGAKSGAQLKTIEGQLIAAMPRMEGPQSDADRILYQKAAGDLANTMKPVSVRQAASSTLRELQQKYAGGGSGGASGGWSIEKVD